MKKGVIVIGGHVQGLGIVRILGKQNIPIIVIDDKKYNLARHSKYCDNFFLYKEDQLLRFLLKDEICNKYSQWLIFPTDDQTIKVISKNLDILKNIYKVSTCEWSIISKFYNKINTYKLCEKLRIKAPYTVFPKDISDINNFKFQYPVIIKPAIMHKFYTKTKKKVFNFLIYFA